MPSQITPLEPPTEIESLIDGLLRKREIAKILRVSPRTIDKWVADRRIPFIRVTARLNLYRLRDVERALSKRTIREA